MELPVSLKVIFPLGDLSGLSPLEQKAYFLRCSKGRGSSFKYSGDRIRYFELSYRDTYLWELFWFFLLYVKFTLLKDKVCVCFYCQGRDILKGSCFMCCLGFFLFLFVLLIWGGGVVCLIIWSNFSQADACL